MGRAMDWLLIKLYEWLHRRYHARTMRWHRLAAGTDAYMVTLRVYGPEGMRATDVVIENMPGVVRWYRIGDRL